MLGDEPQQLGLGVSLLERLVRAYNNVGKTSQEYIANLCTNYRCHKDILELPSQLFYGSALIPQSTATTHPDAPYPLIFVCSSVADTQQIADDTSDIEATVLINQLYQFCKRGDTKVFLKGTCFMALSRRQV